MLWHDNEKEGNGIAVSNGRKHEAFVKTGEIRDYTSQGLLAVEKGVKGRRRTNIKVH
jgi:hypothetical protein